MTLREKYLIPIKAMLTAKECRHLLADEKMSDEQVADFLAGIRKMTGRYLDNYFKDEFTEGNDV